MARDIYINQPAASLNETVAGVTDRIQGQGVKDRKTAEIGASLLTALSNPQLGTPVKRTAPVKAAPAKAAPGYRPTPTTEDDRIAGEQVVSNVFGSRDISSDALDMLRFRREEKKRQQGTALPYDGPKPLVGPDGQIDPEGTAASLENRSVYKDLPPEARQDAAQADFDSYMSDRVGRGVQSSQSYESEELGGNIVHQFDRDDGISVTFLETPSGKLYNTTDVVKRR